MFESAARRCLPHRNAKRANHGRCLRRGCVCIKCSAGKLAYQSPKDALLPLSTHVNTKRRTSARVSQARASLDPILSLIQMCLGPATDMAGGQAEGELKDQLVTLEAQLQEIDAVLAATDGAEPELEEVSSPRQCCSTTATGSPASHALTSALIAPAGQGGASGVN